MVNRHTVRVMRIAELELSINRLTTGELLDTETVTSSSERGGWKRAEYFSTSLAAYSTSCPVLRGLGRSHAPRLPGGRQRLCPFCLILGLHLRRMDRSVWFLLARTIERERRPVKRVGVGAVIRRAAVFHAQFDEGGIGFVCTHAEERFVVIAKLFTRSTAQP